MNQKEGGGIIEILNIYPCCRDNIAARQSDADIDKVLRLHANQGSEDDILHEMKRVPNMSHPSVQNLTEPRLVLQKVRDIYYILRDAVYLRVG